MNLVVQCLKCETTRQPISQDILAKGYGHIGGIDLLPYGMFALKCKCGTCAVYEQNGVPVVHTGPWNGQKPFRFVTRREMAEEKKDETPM